MSKVPFQLLELSIHSAQDLAPIYKNMRTYAVIWISPERKLQTKIDQQGHVNPSWNDKFVFRVDDKFLDSETGAVMIEVYALGWMRDVRVGSVRVLISNLIPQALREQNNSSRRFVALQIRRPSGRPQGILNMGVTLLDNTMRSMPLTDLSVSAVGYRDLMDGKSVKLNIDDKNTKHVEFKTDQKDDKGEKKGSETKKPEQEKEIKLWRSRSDRSDLNSISNPKPGRKPGGGASSVVNGGSMINGGSMMNGGSAINGSEVGGQNKGGSMLSLDLGPSPSVVATAVQRGLYPTQLPVPHEAGSSILGDWTVEESSVEGLKSKIDRWRMELPPMYNNLNDNNNNQRGAGGKTKKSKRRGGGGGHGSADAKLFSCFGNLCGCEIQIVCGGDKKKQYRCDSSRLDSGLSSY